MTRSRQQNRAQQSTGLSPITLYAILGIQFLVLLGLLFMFNGRVSNLAAEQAILVSELKQIRASGSARAPSSTRHLSFAPGPRGILFGGVTGAPGDGNVALSTAMTGMLTALNVRAADQSETDALVVSGEVTRTPTEDAEQIRIIWALTKQDGSQLGQVVQNNKMPLGRFDQPWGDDAIFAASGAREGLVRLFEHEGALTRVSK